MLAMTDKRSILFQILFAVFDSLQGFVIVMVHCILRREVEDDFKSSFFHPQSIFTWGFLFNMSQGLDWLKSQINPKHIELSQPERKSVCFCSVTLSQVNPVSFEI